MLAKYLPTIALLAFLIIFLGQSFMINISWLLSRQSLLYLFQNRWDLAASYIAVYSLFLLFTFLPFKKGGWKKSSSIYVAFIIALFAEMFGFPLTVYFLSSFISIKPLQIAPSTGIIINLLGENYMLLLTDVIAFFATVVGCIFIILGWIGVYNSKGKLVTKGIYKHLRHPQYFGILLMSFVLLLSWPTLLTLILWPILFLLYYRLAKSEDKFLEKQFGRKYLEYKRKTPMLMPII